MIHKNILEILIILERIPGLARKNLPSLCHGHGLEWNRSSFKWGKLWHWNCVWTKMTENVCSLCWIKDHPQLVHTTGHSLPQKKFNSPCIPPERHPVLSWPVTVTQFPAHSLISAVEAVRVETLSHTFGPLLVMFKNLKLGLGVPLAAK